MCEYMMIYTCAAPVTPTVAGDLEMVTDRFMLEARLKDPVIADRGVRAYYEQTDAGVFRHIDDSPLVDTFTDEDDTSADTLAHRRSIISDILIGYLDDVFSSGDDEPWHLKLDHREVDVVTIGQRPYMATGGYSRGEHPSAACDAVMAFDLVSAFDEPF